MARGRFIVFEGLDGAGTSTQARLLYNRMIGSDYPSFLTSEPTDGFVGRWIKRTFRGEEMAPRDPAQFDRHMALLFAGDRYDHVYEREDSITSLTDRGVHVVCTRYVLSSLAYHVTTAQDEKFVREINRMFPPADCTIFLTTSIETTLQRLAQRPILDTYEMAEKQQKVAVRYAQIMREYEGRKICIEGYASPQDIHDQIWEQIEPLLEEELTS